MNQTMDLILWRHADAGQQLDDAVLDLQRALSPKGLKHAARMAAWLNSVLPERTRVLVSPALAATGPRCWRWRVGPSGARRC